MTGMLKDWGLALIIVVGVLFVWNLMQPGAPDLAGDAAPDFTLSDLQGQEYTLSEQQGKVVVINFWATWCGPCRQEIPAFAKFHEEHPEIQMYGVSVDDKMSAARLEAAAKRLGINYTVLHDKRSLASRAYQVTVLPTTFVIGEDGQVLRAHAGPLSLARLETLVNGS